jgi:hypothetical protein
MLTNVAGYLYRNRTRMRYNEYLAQGLPIASGPVEGACRQTPHRIHSMPMLRC